MAIETTPSSTERFERLMQQGMVLHDKNQAEAALICFEEALALAPHNIQAINACATLLIELLRPHAAHALMQEHTPALLLSADGACNWAIVCESVSLFEQAAAAYTQALQIDHQHIRALNNSALLAAREQNFKLAIEQLTQCVALDSQRMAWQINLIDVLTADHQIRIALATLKTASQLFEERAEFAVRQATLLAFDGQLEDADQALQNLQPAALQMLLPYWESIGIQASRFGWQTDRLPAAGDVYLLSAFLSMQDCHWRNYPQLLQLSASMLKQSHRAQEPHNWRDLQFYALMLPLPEAQQAHAMEASRRFFSRKTKQTQHMTMIEHADGRIHLAIATQNLQESRAHAHLLAWLSRIDSKRFATHIYANTPSPTRALSQDFLPHCTSFTEAAHLTGSELAARIRLDQPHLFMDTAFYTPWCRAEIPFLGVAPIHFRHQTWHRHKPVTTQFAIGDHFTHSAAMHAPDPLDACHFGPTIRLPYSCWLAADDTPPDAQAPSRQSLGLPDGAFVLCSRQGSPMIDPATFALWMRIMLALPHAVLWLPHYARAAQLNLHIEAEQAGISASRLVFAKSDSREQQLAQLRHADLFLDALLFNANHGLVDALRMGVPALSCAGMTLASRLGGSIIRAAGLHEMVFDSEVLGVEAARQQYLERAISLGQNADELLRLTARLKTLQSSAPLFQFNQRVAEWQTAWEMMAAQARQGAEFTAFDVPSAI